MWTFSGRERCDVRGEITLALGQNKVSRLNKMSRFQGVHIIRYHYTKSLVKGLAVQRLQTHSGNPVETFLGMEEMADSTPFTNQWH